MDEFAEFVEEVCGEGGVVGGEVDGDEEGVELGVGVMEGFEHGKSGKKDKEIGLVVFILELEVSFCEG